MTAGTRWRTRLTDAFRAWHRVIVSWIPLEGEAREDADATMAAVCAEAYAKSGWAGLLRAGWLECLDALRQLLRARLPHKGPSAAGPDPGGRWRPTAPASLRRLPQDAKHAWRVLRLAPASVVISVVTLSVGIGLSTAVFSILDAILWRPVPFADATRLVELGTVDLRNKFTFAGGFSPAALDAWRWQTDLFDRLEAFDTPSFVYAAPEGSEMVAGAIVTPGLIRLLGGRAEVGRVFQAGDGREDTADIAIVSDAFWRNRLQGAPDVVGQRLSIDNADYRIVGVMPRAFRFPTEQVAVWLPIDPDAQPATAQARSWQPLGRLAIGVTLAAAEPEARARGERLARAADAKTGVTATLFTIDRYVDDRTRTSLWVLAAAVGFLMLVVCANAANLALARAVGRARETAVHSALGASRADIIRGALVEGALVAAIGCLGGVLAAALLVRLAISLLPEALTLSTLTAIEINGRALLCAVALGALAAVAFGLPIALAASRQSVASLLNDQSRAATGSSAARRSRGALIVTEVALSIVLLVGAALMTRSLIRLEGANKGFDPAGLIYVRLALPSSGYADPVSGDRFVQDAVDRLRQLPGVTAATVGELPTEHRVVAYGHLEVADRPGEQTPRVIVPMHEVSPSYFATLALPLLDGQTVPSTTGPNLAVVVSEYFASKFFPRGHAVGARFRIDADPWQTIVGVADNTRPMAADDPSQRLLSYAFYYAVGQAPSALREVLPHSTIAGYRTLLIRSVRPAATVTSLSGVIHGLDPHVVISKTALVEHMYAEAIARPRIVLTLMALFAGASLLLAAAGIFGVLSHLVTQQRREIGIRLALGAAPRDVGRLVLRNGTVLTGFGLFFGLLAALGLTRVMRTLLYETGPSDPISIVAVSVLVALTAFVACARPTRQAMRTDPARLLRQE